jgi:hypothetical protein
MIDQGTLRKQQLAVVRQPGAETSCSRCGKRTRDVTGTCRSCREVMPSLGRMSVAQLGALVEQAKAELQRRRDEVEAALKGES